MSQMTINTPNSTLAASIADDFCRKGLAFPDIKQIIFNMGTKTIPAVFDKDGNVLKAATTRPALATIVTFVDGSKVTVVNSDHDHLHLDAEGHPSQADKEAGIVYALAKRLLATNIVEGELGNCRTESAGFGRILSGLVKNAHDQQAELKKRAEAKAAAKQRHEANLKAAAERKCKSPSTEQRIMDLLEGIKLIAADLAEKKQR